jgi:hypothetical protein
MKVRKPMYELAWQSFMYGIIAMAACCVVCGITSFIKKKCKQFCNQNRKKEQK